MSSKLVALAAAGVILMGTGLASTPASAQWHRGGGAGAAVAGGILGLATGAMIGAAVANQPPPPPMAYPGYADPAYMDACARKYRSFDPGSGTFMARDGNRYPCRLP